MFGLDGKSFWSNIKGHYYVHYQKNPKKVFERINLQRTFGAVKKSKADVIGICEIYEGQEKEISKGLKKLGYKFVYFGRGHKFKYNRRHVFELIASKKKFKQLKYREWPLENHLGGGGGFVVCKFKNMNIFHVHLGLPNKKFFYKQIGHIQEILKKLRGKKIIMGDFNCSYDQIQKYFSEFSLVTKELKTCSNTPIMKWFYNKDADHILVKGFKAKKIGTIDGDSDHKLIWADLI